ncbi:uncharacterized protein LOC106648889 [Trichogramma pretiosum]|uniref:uncharacterized protein LOC106648889 n=1 Tax=Trichogramma pretiosum TaxID=7493 RepID=UPI0006C949AF|nr:uncharacterized protein LOC106648889 [Trichogramma pretiosum]
MELANEQFKDLYGEYDLDLTVTFDDCEGPKWTNDKKLICPRIGLLIAMHLHKTTNTGWDDLSEFLGWQISEQLRTMPLSSGYPHTIIFHQFIVARSKTVSLLRADSNIIKSDVKFATCDNVYKISYKAKFQFTYSETRVLKPGTSVPYPVHYSYNQSPEWHSTVSKIFEESDAFMMPYEGDIGNDLLNKLCTTISHHISSAIEDMPREKDKD